MIDIYFVTPAYLRYDVSHICFAEFVWAFEEMKRWGINTQAVVVSDDQNLDIARSFGFDTVEQNNEWLGRKFNDGIEFAYRQDADFVVPIGSDSWIDPSYFSTLPNDDQIQSGNLFSAFDVDGLRRVDLFVEWRGLKSGIGPFVIPRALLKECVGRPARDNIRRGIDYSVVRGVEASGEVDWYMKNTRTAQYINFKSVEAQLTPFERLINRYLVYDVTVDPFDDLIEVYPENLVWKAEKMYEQRRANGQNSCVD